MIGNSFSVRTLANMEVALDRACMSLAAEGDQHPARSFIGQRLVELAQAGNTTLSGLTEAAMKAAKDYRATIRSSDAA